MLRVVEYGAIEDLLKRKGHYYRLVMSRTGLSIDRKGNGRCTPERLRQVWIFATAPLESLQKLTQRFVTRTLMSDEIVCEKGADADAMFFLVKGQIEAFDGDGGEGPRKEDEDKPGTDEVSEAEGVGDTKGSAAAHGGKRFVYMSGEDFGVEGRTCRESQTRYILGYLVVARTCQSVLRSNALLALPYDEYESVGSNHAKTRSA